MLVSERFQKRMLFARDREGGGSEDVEIGASPAPRGRSPYGLKEASAKIQAVNIQRGVRELAL
jgi:hypothetical protein